MIKYENAKLSQIETQENAMTEKEMHKASVTAGKKTDKHDIINYIVLGIIGVYFCVVTLLYLKAKVPEFQAFNTVFISIIIQAFPFMLVGVFVSSVLHIFVPEKVFVKIFPVKNGTGFITALFIGLLFPVCECAIVPVMRQLIKKGVPVPIAVTFMMAAPIINPISLISTYYAFPGQPYVVFLRLGLGLAVALLIGLALLFMGEKNSVFRELTSEDEDCACTCGHSHTHESTCSCGHSHTHESTCSCGHDHEEHTKKSSLGKIKEVFVHSGNEFFAVGKYLIIGAFIAALMQRLIPQSLLTGISGQNVIPLLVMMLAAFCFSACSTSDAFIARGFLNSFSLSSVMGFLVFGPMMDVKNMMLLLGSFKKEFVIRLTVLVVIINLLVLVIAASFMA